VRLLARLDEGDAPAAADAFAPRLSGWFDWTDAIALSAALTGAPEGGYGFAPSAAAEERELARVRGALARLATQAPAPAPDPRRLLRPAPPAPVHEPGDFTPHRERYAAAQQAMEARIGPARQRLRAALQSASPALARLAALDEVMERVVGEQELVLLATVARRLERRFERLRDAPGRPDAWLDVFRRDMNELLLAELDLRLQPLEGLLDALRRHE
jgi:hypothetical protein